MALKNMTATRRHLVITGHQRSTSRSATLPTSNRQSSGSGSPSSNVTLGQLGVKTVVWRGSRPSYQAVSGDSSVTQHFAYLKPPYHLHAELLVARLHGSGQELLQFVTINRPLPYSQPRQGAYASESYLLLSIGHSSDMQLARYRPRLTRGTGLVLTPDPCEVDITGGHGRSGVDSVAVSLFIRNAGSLLLE